jgi:hypothetical protein
MKRALLLAFALLPAATQADEVFTRGGGQLVGEIVERGPDSIVVDIGAGRIGIPLSFVERIVPGPSPPAVYRERAQRLAPDDAPGWVALGRWAREQDLRTQADQAFRQALEIDPGNAGAHQALGHVKLGDQWMTREESYRALGLVPFEGRWVTPEEQQALLADRVAAAERAQAEADAFARVRETEARVRVAEAQARVAEAEARLAEADVRRAESAAVGIFHTFPGVGFHTGLGFSNGFGHGFHPGHFAGCRRAPRFVVWPHSPIVTPRRPLAIPLAGRGGSFVVSSENVRGFRP